MFLPGGRAKTAWSACRDLGNVHC